MARHTPTAQANRQSRPSPTTALAGAGVGSAASLAAALAHAPWGVVLTVALAGLLVTLVQSAITGTIPQDSADRLTWWQTYWTHRRERTRLDTPPDTRPPA
ncbi:hypothetical protein AB0F30_22355 [Streptomyces sp. NPDC029006]|uniref:hypothetical protein n=1 Tax=Streptomyces sp. NPDC029006 TaxID=3155467 RepID=UPI0033DC59CB